MAINNVCVQLNWGEIQWMWNKVRLLLIWFFSMLVWINQGVEENKQTHWDWSLRPQTHTYMVRGHEIKVVAVVGVEGHDVVDRFAGWQLQRPLIGQGHVRQEGQLWKRHQGKWTQVGLQHSSRFRREQYMFSQVRTPEPQLLFINQLNSCKIQEQIQIEHHLYVRGDSCHQSTSWSLL